MPNIYLSEKIKKYWIDSQDRYSMHDFNKFLQYFFEGININIHNQVYNNECDGVIHDIQDLNIFTNKINIMLCVENCSARLDLNHYNKYKDYSDDKIKIYLYNHIDKIKKTQNYIAIPIIYLQINYFKNFFNNITPSIYTPYENKKFCLIATSLINSDKISIYNMLSNIGNCDRIEDFKQTIENKSCYHSTELLDIFNQYKFVFVSENSINDGYITEKIFNCYFSRTIPIYYGSKKAKYYFNSKSFIHIDNLDNLDEISKIIKNISKDSYDSYINNNIINETYCDENYKNLLNDFIKKNEVNNIISVNSDKNIKSSYDKINSFNLDQGKILFFDIFINNDKLHIISPKYSNFSIDYNSIKIYLLNSNTKIELKQESEFTNTDYIYEPFNIKIYKLPENINSEENIEVEYNNITKNYLLYKYVNYSTNKSQNKFLLSATTLFKDDWDRFNQYYRYYSNQGIEYFYMYYNGIATEEIKEKFNYYNVKLIDWNFQYWNENIVGQHVAQVGQLQHSLYKYGKIQTQFMTYCDLDEFMFIPNVTIKEFIQNPQFPNSDTIGFQNHWCMTIDGKVFDEFPEKFLKSSEKFTFGHNQRSKCIHRVDSHDYIYIHMPQINKNKNIILNDNLFLFHFANWNSPDRNKLENPQIVIISPTFKDRLNSTRFLPLIKYSEKIVRLNKKFKSNKKIKIGSTKNAFEWYPRLVNYIKNKFNGDYNQTYTDTQADIYIYTQIDSHKTNDKTLSILISGESHPINYSNFDIIINKDKIENYPTISYSQLFLSLDERHNLNKTFDTSFSNKKNIAFMYHIDYPHRVGIFMKFNKEIGVDSFGKSCNNVKVDSTRFTYTEKETYNDIAVNIYSKYKFVLAIENTIKPMYFTEKLINPILANSIPIYYGTKDAFKVINKKRVIYFSDYKSTDELIIKVKEIMNSEEQYNQIISEPTFNPESGFTLDNYKDYLYSSLDSYLGFKSRIFSDSQYLDDFTNSAIKINLNKTCKKELYKTLFPGDSIDNYIPTEDETKKLELNIQVDIKDDLEIDEQIEDYISHSESNSESNKVNFQTNQVNSPTNYDTNLIQKIRAKFDINKIKEKLDKLDLNSIDSIKNHIQKYSPGVDKIYWINLERSIDRRIKMETILNLFPIKNFRYEAVDGITLSDEEIYSKFSTEKFYRRKVEYACFLSHLNVIKTISEGLDDIVLVLEDDMNLELLKFWDKSFQEIINHAPADWDIILLTYTSQFQLTELFTHNPGNIYSAGAYIINKKAAQKLMNLMYKNEKFELENYVQGSMKHHVSDSYIYALLKSYVYKYPYFTYPLDNDTNINPHQAQYHNNTKFLATVPWLELYSN